MLSRLCPCSRWVRPSAVITSTSTHCAVTSTTARRGHRCGQEPGVVASPGAAIIADSDARSLIRKAMAKAVNSR